MEDSKTKHPGARRARRSSDAKRQSVYLDADLRGRVEQLARRYGVSVSAVCAAAISLGLQPRLLERMLREGEPED